MRIFDPHIHMSSRTTDDYEAMYAAACELSSFVATTVPPVPRANVVDHLSSIESIARTRVQCRLRNHGVGQLTPMMSSELTLCLHLEFLGSRELVMTHLRSLGKAH